MQRRRDRYARQAATESTKKEAFRARGERQRQACGMDLTGKTLAELETLGQAVRDELAFRLEEYRRDAEEGVRRMWEAYRQG